VLEREPRDGVENVAGGLENQVLRSDENGDSDRAWEGMDQCHFGLTVWAVETAFHHEEVPGRCALPLVKTSSKRLEGVGACEMTGIDD
jgi:hypothetical protein